ncbi:MAG: DUF983 domain-containing protein [Flavobacteriales bacterium]|nr:DUF983 domain-containing protein [Flavobacteriales bacterium]
MVRKGTKPYCILHRKCPHCHEGEFMVTRDPYDLSRAGDLLDGCSVCHRKFETEPGFYYGGMYVSYASAVALGVVIYVATGTIAPSTTETTRLWLVLGGLVALTPVLYAWSKIIWACLFIDYKGVDPLPGEDPKWVKR